MYAHEMVRMEAEPNGAAVIGGIACAPPVLTIGCPGKNGAKCDATPMGLRFIDQNNETGLRNAESLPDTWSTPAVRDCEGFMQIQVADICAALGRTCQTDHSILAKRRASACKAFLSAGDRAYQIGTI